MDLIEDEGRTCPSDKHPRRGSVGTIATANSTPLPPCPSVSPISSLGYCVSSKLGDFSKLTLAVKSVFGRTAPGNPQSLDSTPRHLKDSEHLLSAGLARPKKTSGSVAEESEGNPLFSLKLGNFAKIFRQLGTPERPCSGDEASVASVTPTLHTRQLPVDIPGAGRETGNSHWKAKNASQARGDLSDSDASPSAEFDSEYRAAADIITPSTSWDEVLCPPDGALRNKSVDKGVGSNGAVELPTQMHHAKQTPKQAQRRDGKLAPNWLCDWFVRGGPRQVVMPELLTREGARQGLREQLVPLVANDTLLAKAFPNVASNGVHCFIDHSNISISFQQFLKARFGIPDNARFHPIPEINLSFLHQLLLRNRTHHTLFAAGSVGCKDKHEPAFVQELTRLGYMVDLRERVRVEDPATRGLKRSSGRNSDSEYSPVKDKIRYKEEFVDESLQSRIGATLLDFTDTPGTMIFVTGDGKPAQFSDGFVRYAERALKHGFLVEVVSWKRSLSKEWENLRYWQENKSVLGADRFRIIELDPFFQVLVSGYLDD